MRCTFRFPPSDCGPRSRTPPGSPAPSPASSRTCGSEPVAGRLKVRVGSHSITYRGAVRVSAQDDGTYAVEGDATEARGSGSVKLALTLRVRESDGGCTLVFDGTATADGRITELAPDAVRSAASRLLDRFAENLGADMDETGVDELGVDEPEKSQPADPTSVFSRSGSRRDGRARRHR